MGRQVANDHGLRARDGPHRRCPGRVQGPGKHDQGFSQAEGRSPGAPHDAPQGDEGVRRRGQQVSASNRIRSIIRRMRAHSTMYAVLLAAFLTLSCGASLHGSSAALAKGPPASGGDLAWVEDAAEGCLRGKVAVVTGATQGIGLEVARLLAGRARADLVMACRNMTACSTVAAQIRQDFPGAAVQCAHLDLASLASVSHFADALPRMHKSGVAPHLLVQNAGVMGVKNRQTEDGFETTFQVNHLAPLLLALRLFPALASDPSSPSSHYDPASPTAASADATRGAAGKGAAGENGDEGAGARRVGWGEQPRVVWVSSGLHRWGTVTDEANEVEVEGGVCGLDAVAYRQNRGWGKSIGSFQAYATSKLFNSLTAAEAAARFAKASTACAAQKPERRLSADAAPLLLPTAVSVRPGTVATGIARDLPWWRGVMGVLGAAGMLRSPEEAARGVVFAALAPPPLVQPGGYYDHGAPASLHPAVLDRSVSSRVWDESEAMLRTWRLLTGARPWWQEAKRERRAPRGDVPTARALAADMVMDGYDRVAAARMWEEARFSIKPGTGEAE